MRSWSFVRCFGAPAPAPPAALSGAPPAVPLRPGPLPFRCVQRRTSRCAPAAAHLPFALLLLPASPVGPALPAGSAPPVSSAPPDDPVSAPVPRTAPVIALFAQQQQVRQLIKKNDNIAVRCPLLSMPLPMMPLCPAPGAIRTDSRRSPACDVRCSVPAVRKVQYVLVQPGTRCELRAGPTAGISVYQYVLYFSYSGYRQTSLDAVFGADHDARISSGQGRRQLPAFQLQSAHFARVHPETGSPPAGCMLLADLN
jgi:hypothetical protein